MNKLSGNFLICWLGWGIPMGLLFSVMFASLQKGMLSGIAGGLLFAVIMILFTAVLSSRKDKLRERYGIEGTVLRDGAEEEFIVNDRREWIGFLKEKCGM